MARLGLGHGPMARLGPSNLGPRVYGFTRGLGPV